jgi:UDPglucose 6-dehydrogenase
MAQRIAVIGTGYVGLVTGACLADVGNEVLCIDVDPKKIDRLRQGEVPIYEPGLDIVLARAIREQRIEFSLDLAEAVRSCDILMFCLPTPPGKDGHECC